MGQGPSRDNEALYLGMPTPSIASFLLHHLQYRTKLRILAIVALATPLRTNAGWNSAVLSWLLFCGRGSGCTDIFDQNDFAGIAMREVAVIYLFRFAEGESPVSRFLRSYRKHPAGIDHDFYVAFKGFRGNSGDRPQYMDFDLPAPDSSVDRIALGSVYAFIRRADRSLDEGD